MSKRSWKSGGRLACDELRAERNLMYALCWQLAATGTATRHRFRLLTHWWRRTFGRCRSVGLRKSSLLSSPAFHFADSLFHLLAWFERDHKLLGDKHFVTGPWVAGFACGPAFYLKDAKVS